MPNISQARIRLKLLNRDFVLLRLPLNRNHVRVKPVPDSTYIRIKFKLLSRNLVLLNAPLNGGPAKFQLVPSSHHIEGIIKLPITRDYDKLQPVLKSNHVKVRFKLLNRSSVLLKLTPSNDCVKFKVTTNFDYIMNKQIDRCHDQLKLPLHRKCIRL